MNFYNNWGKFRTGSDEEFNYHLLAYHCLDVAATANSLLHNDKIFLEKFKNYLPIEDDDLICLITFYIAIHDIGKFSKNFQSLQPHLMKKLRGYSSEKSYEIRHDSLGYHLWNSLWNDLWKMNILSLDKTIYDEFDWNELILPWLRATTGHHGYPPIYINNGVQINYDELFSSDDKEMAVSYIESISQLILKNGFSSLTSNSGDVDIFEDLERYFKKTSWLLSGLAVVSDWIGSSESYFNYNSSIMNLEKYWTEIALPASKKALKDSGICPSQVSHESGINHLFGYIKKPTPMQNFVSEMELGNGPQLFIIEDTTGSGKTEAAISLSHRLMIREGLHGLFFGLPTMATSNAMYERLYESYSKIYEPISNPSLVLAHGQSHLSKIFRNTIGPNKTENDFYGENNTKESTISAQCSAWIADNRKKSLLADVGVGTIDQAIMSVLPSKHQSLRLLGLSRNVLIVDEVHAYDPYMHELLCNLLTFHASLGGSVILLSATLPLKQKNDLVRSFSTGAGYEFESVSKIEYPLVTHISSSGSEEQPVDYLSQNERVVSCEFFHDKTHVRKSIIDASNNGFCCCWIRNTVDDAIDAYNSIANCIGHENVILFHARFTMGDRLKIEESVLETFGKNSGNKQRAGKILISTQVVEQSLDLDFDYMVTDLAPIDLIIQRAGRLHRHKRDLNGNIATQDSRKTPVLGILSPRPTEDASDSWYSGMFSKGCYVYQTHGKLWLTAKLLLEMKEMHIPRDSRYLIEGVFGPNADESIPSALLNVDRNAYGETMAEKSMAVWRSLKIFQGYDRTGTQWIDDTVVPTRLGDSITLRLGKLVNGAILPLNSSTRHPWEMSQVNVSAIRVKYPSYPEEINELIDETKNSMKDKCKWSLFIPMELQEDGMWLGFGENQNRQKVKLIYDAKTGLHTSKY
ncbi:CRISPR-associated helicase Cas3 [Methanosalsum zhilinae DSM 4017]|uniref:CRISPR-associated helicase Cas3 n=1 Tax=Methanosalsum zhilinae (strain DSM 4017 / NBRC 107636 / OCM 62 / WeN5) TaxID=679901 RepID=F7XPH6_METZD|nr:CRISPR-associated helicase/endonuclease Cas3 [Methanosalsum zhilinae]AEH61401.1 CRISPR-associated helicase Cas3 [Methanosalsum zhilinae DSM 4017]